MARFTVFHYRKDTPPPPAESTYQAAPTSDMCFGTQDNTYPAPEDNVPPYRPRSPTWAELYGASRSTLPAQPSPSAVQTPSLGPSTPASQQQLHPQPVAKPPKPDKNQVRLDRLADIRTRIDALRPDIEARKTVHTLILKQQGLLNNPRNVQWRQRVIFEQRTYEAIERELTAVERRPHEKGMSGWVSKIKLSTLVEWEMKMDNLRWSNMSYHERHDWEAYDNYLEDPKGVFDKEWTWGAATAKAGPGLEEHVDPHDVSKANEEEGAGDPMYTEAYNRKAQAVVG